MMIMNRMFLAGAVAVSSFCSQARCLTTDYASSSYQTFVSLVNAANEVETNAVLGVVLKLDQDARYDFDLYLTAATNAIGWKAICRDSERSFRRAWGRRDKAERARNIPWTISRLSSMSEEERMGLSECARSEELLARLAEDSSLPVRLQVAKNRYTTQRIFDKLAKDADESVVACVAKMRYRAHSPIPSLPTWPCLSLRTVALATQTNDLLRLAWRICSMPDAFIQKRQALLGLSAQLADVRHSPDARSVNSATPHDLSLVGGKCAWLLERILGVKLASVTKATPQDVLTSQKKRVEALVHERYGEKPSSP